MSLVSEVVASRDGIDESNLIPSNTGIPSYTAFFSGITWGHRKLEGEDAGGVCATPQEAAEARGLDGAALGGLAG